MKRRKCRRDEIFIRTYMAELFTSCDRETSRVIEARIVERTFAMHLEIRDECIPIRDGSPSCPGVQIHSCEPESGGNQCGGSFSVRAKPLAVEEKLCIEFARPPC